MPSASHAALLEQRALAPVSFAPLAAIHPRGNYQFRFVAEPVGGSIKRLLDLSIAASALLVLAAPLFLIGLLVRMDSSGPSLFRQKRTGFRGRAFDVLKFRTMARMENGSAVRQATVNDARVTRLGRFLRKTSLDELPQLINVLRGDMSLVGPRPHALVHDDEFYAINHAYPARFFARPGITGLAQVRGCRGATDTPDKVEARLACDLEYIEQWSLWRDIAILASTVRLVAHDANAY